MPFLGTRLVLVLVGLMAEFYFLPLLDKHRNFTRHSIAANLHFPDNLWLMWQRYDSGFYLDMSLHGYWPAKTLHHASNWAFFPLYPLVIRPFAYLFGGTWNAASVAALLVSNVAAVAAIVYIYLLVRQDFSAQVAARTVLYLGLFPMAFYLSAVYAESLFLACAAASMYYARRRRWWLAGLCGGLSALCRAQGFLMVVPLAWEYWQVLSERYAPLPEGYRTLPAWERLRFLAHSRLRGPELAARDWRNWLVLPALALVPAGLLAFMLYAQAKTGDWLATFHNEGLHWQRHFVWPWHLIKESLLHPHVANPRDFDFWLFNLVVVFAFLALTAVVLWRLPGIYGIYTLLSVLLPLSSNLLNSIGRYYVIVFPVMIVLAIWSSHDHRQTRDHLIVGTFAALQAMLMAFFVLGLPAIA